MVYTRNQPAGKGTTKRYTSGVYAVFSRQLVEAGARDRQNDLPLRSFPDFATPEKADGWREPLPYTHPSARPSLLLFSHALYAALPHIRRLASLRVTSQ